MKINHDHGRKTPPDLPGPSPNIVSVEAGLWFNLGHTFGGFTGLTPDTAPGLYLRLDFMGGGR